MNDYEGKEYLTAKEAADYLRVSVDTILRWRKDGKFRGATLSPQHVIFKKSKIDKLLEESEYPELQKAREELKIDDGSK